MEQTQEKFEVKFVHSFKMKMMQTCAVTAIVITIAVLLLVIPNARNIIARVNSNYMYSEAAAYGQNIENVLRIAGPLAITYQRDPDYMGNLTANAKIKDVETSYCYMISANEAKMICHPDSNMVGTIVVIPEIKAVLDDIAAGKEVTGGTLEYNQGGVDKIAGYYYSQPRNFLLVIVADKDDLLSGINKVQRAAWGIALVVLAIVLGLVYLIANRQTKPMVQVVSVVDRISSLDLTEDETMEMLRRDKGETGAIVFALDKMKNSLVEIVTDMNRQSGQLHEAADELNSSVEKTSKNVGGVETAVGEIANGATNQANQTQRATDEILIMGKMIENTHTQVSSLNETAEMMKQSNEIASKALTELGEVNKAAITSINEIYEDTNATNASTVKIKEATSLIASIADETNLLSLNASIEAARAGEAGRGFAVVASQIQKLAEQSNDSAKRIDDIIKELASNSERAVQTMEEVRAIMERQTENVNKTQELFEQVRIGIGYSIQGVDEISGQTSKLDDTRNSIVDAVQSLSCIAQENAASTQETSASMVEINSVLQQITDDSSDLRNIAASMDATIQKFII
ncbi:MAG: methyl-accepting chemotaxis protein [Pseudobutyrivibrio sp.]|nr:methyl-accepting chemotaxis protein [Pseudobutyrivibrio sp.]